MKNVHRCQGIVEGHRHRLLMVFQSWSPWTYIACIHFLHYTPLDVPMNLITYRYLWFICHLHMGVSTIHDPFILTLFVSPFLHSYLFKYSFIFFKLMQCNKFSYVYLGTCQCLYLCSQFLKNFLKSFLIALKNLKSVNLR